MIGLCVLLLIASILITILTGGALGLLVWGAVLLGVTTYDGHPKPDFVAYQIAIESVLGISNVT